MSRTHRALVMLALSFVLAIATTAVAIAAQPTPPTIEDQNDRLLRHQRAEQAAGEQAAVEAARSMERSFVPASTADSPAGSGGWLGVLRPWPAGRPPPAGGCVGRLPLPDPSVHTVSD